VGDCFRWAKGTHRIYIHGEKECEEAKRRAIEGIPLEAEVKTDLAIAEELSIEYDL